MYTFTTEYDRPLSLFDELRRRMDRVWEDIDVAPDTSFYGSSGWPQVDLFDAGTAVVLRADLPGLTDKDVNLILTATGVALSGERKSQVPEGYTPHRQERGALKFSRSVSLPCKVDPDKTTATLKDGVLTVTLPKATEAQPRQIAVRAS